MTNYTEKMAAEPAEAHRSLQKPAEAQPFPNFLTTLDILRQLYSIFVFVLFAMQYKVRLSSTKCYHLF